MERTIILVRHGESVANVKRTLTGQTDPGLTRLGFAQSKRAARFIRNRLMPVDLVVSSPLTRAVRTAEAIARKVGAPSRTDELLMETNFGGWEGRSKAELETFPGWDSYASDPFHFRFPGGESPQDVKGRVRAFRDKIALEGGWRTLVVVSHYTPIVFFILGVICNGDAKTAPFRLDNASLSVILSREGHEILTMLNFSP